MKAIMACVLAGLMAVAVGCTVIRGAGITEDMNPAVKQLVMKRVARELKSQGLEVSNKELSKWYDDVVASAEIQAIAEEIGGNVSVKARAEDLIKEYYPAIIKAAAKSE